MYKDEEKRKEKREKKKREREVLDVAVVANEFLF